MGPAPPSSLTKPVKSHFSPLLLTRNKETAVIWILAARFVNISNFISQLDCVSRQMPTISELISTCLLEAKERDENLRETKRKFVWSCHQRNELNYSAPCKCFSNILLWKKEAISLFKYTYVWSVFSQCLWKAECEGMEVIRALNAAWIYCGGEHRYGGYVAVTTW